MAAPRIAFYGDDFTGSTDTLATVAAAGLKTMLFLAPPDSKLLAATGELDCVGLAGTGRAMSTAEMDQHLPAVFRRLADTGARILHYKTCSTFDSAPTIGSIGRAIMIARDEIRPAFIPIVGGQPSLGRYCIFSNLFASSGLGGDIFRIDRHPTMRHHPVTPMDEADLRLHLQRQDLEHIASFDIPCFRGSEIDIDRRLDALLAEAPDAVLFDVAEEPHLREIGRLLWSRAAAGRVFAFGPTGVEQALLAHWAMSEAHAAPRPAVRPSRVDQTFVIAGSLSPVTAAQIKVAEGAGFVTIDLDAGPLAGLDGNGSIEPILNRITQPLAAGLSVIACTAPSHGPERERADRGAMLKGDDRFGRRIAHACGALLAGVLERVPLRRVGIAGGDTSSFAMQALPIQALSYAFSLSPGVAVCRAHAPGRPLDGIEIMLKGGQMGPPDVFGRLLRGA